MLAILQNKQVRNQYILPSENVITLFLKQSFQLGQSILFKLRPEFWLLFARWNSKFGKLKWQSVGRTRLTAQNKLGPVELWKWISFSGEFLPARHSNHISTTISSGDFGICKLSIIPFLLLINYKSIFLKHFDFMD